MGTDLLGTFKWYVFCVKILLGKVIEIVHGGRRKYLDKAIKTNFTVHVCNN